MHFCWLYPVVAFSLIADDSIIANSLHHSAIESAVTAPMVLALDLQNRAPLPPRTISQQYDSVMKNSAHVKLGVASKSVTDLVQLYRRVSKDKDLKFHRKRKMQNRLAIRMARFHTIVVRDFKRGERHRKRALKYSKRSPREIEVPKSGAGTVLQNAMELIELIQDTIEPESWAANGGLGTIDFYRPLNALVIRNTLQVHKKIGGNGGK